MSEIPGLRLCGAPGSTEGNSCIKRLVVDVDGEGYHGGGHMFATPAVRKVLDGGHYDATALISGQPASWHEPDECHPECPKWKGPLAASRPPAAEGSGTPEVDHE